MATRNFAVDIGWKVKIITNGLEGEVIGLSICQNQTINRILVRYVSNTGSIIEDWLDETLVEAVA